MRNRIQVNFILPFVSKKYIMSKLVQIRIWLSFLTVGSGSDFFLKVNFTRIRNPGYQSLFSVHFITSLEPVVFFYW